MAFKDLFTNRDVFWLIISCLLITSEGNEIMLQEHTDDVRITPATFTEASSASITITAPNNYRVLLKFLKVQLKGGASLEFYNRIGKDRSSERLLTLNRRLIPPPPDLVSPGQRMLIIFSHNFHQTSMESFVLNATLVEEKEYSVELVSGEMRNITSPSYPDNYPRNAFFFYTIDAPTGCRLKHLVVDEDIGHGDTLCISESKIAQRKEQCYVTENATSASLWFSSDSSFTSGRFFVSFWSVGSSDEEPCIQKSYGLSPAPRAHSSNTASKLTRKKRSDNNTGDVSTTSESTQKSTKAEPTPKPWYQYSLWHVVGVLLAIVVIGVFLNQLVRHLMDLCCQTQPVTMTPASAQGRRSSRARSRCCPCWKLMERKSKYVVNKTGISSDDVTVTPGKMDRNTENAKSEDTDYITMTTIAPSSRVPPRRNPSSVSETSHRSYKMYGTEGVAINEISSQSLKATTDSGDPSQGSRDIVSPGTKPASNLLRKSQSSLLGDTYVTGTFDGFDRPRLRSPDSSTPDQTSLSKQPPVRHVKLREKSGNSKFASNRRLSVSMFDLTNHHLADNEVFDPQLGLEHPLDGQITSSEVHQQSNNLKTKGSLIRRRDHEAMSAVTSKDQAMFSSADSLPLICGDEGVQWYSPIEREKELIRKEDPYSTAMAKFDSLCSTLQAEAEGINPEYVNLPPINQNQFAALKRPDRPKPISLKPPIARSLSASAHDLLSTSSSRIKGATKSHPTDDSGPSSKPSKVPHKPNLLSSTLRNPIPFLMERSVTTPADSQTTGNKERVSAYRSYCEIDDIEPGCGVETPGCMHDSQGYNLTNIRLDSI